MLRDRLTSVRFPCDIDTVHLDIGSRHEPPRRGQRPRAVDSFGTGPQKRLVVEREPKPVYLFSKTQIHTGHDVLIDLVLAGNEASICQMGNLVIEQTQFGLVARLINLEATRVLRGATLL